nr:carboxypeptidase-like regulatory domain-containing protein [Streptomyces mangrovisoli]
MALAGASPASGSAAGTTPAATAAGATVSGGTTAGATAAVDEEAGTTGAAPDGPVLSGRVENSAHGPVARATLTLIDQSGHQTARARTRDDGSYTLPRPAPGSYILVVSAVGHQPQALDLQVGDEPAVRTVTLAGAPGLRGTVRAADGSTPAEAAVVVIDARGEVVASATSGADGSYSLPVVPPGRFTVQVSADGHRPDATSVEVGDDGVTRYDVTLQPAGALTGTVRHGTTGLPVAEARITLLSADGTPAATATTSSDGTYTLTDLTPGDYTVVAVGYPPVSRTVTLGGSESPGVDLDLAQPTEAPSAGNEPVESEPVETGPAE